MKTILLACQTMEHEIRWLLERGQCIFDRILWVRSGMHNTSDRLRGAITEQLAAITDAERVILGFGACGNALVGVTAGEFELVIPKVDDCISLMLGSYRRKRQIQKQNPTYFLTQGWLDGPSDIYREYQAAVQTYGREMADLVYEEILGQYRSLGVIDTKACDFPALLERTGRIAGELHLQQCPIEGDLSFLERLLRGPWDGPEFLRIRPHQTVTMELFRMRG